MAQTWEKLIKTPQDEVCYDAVEMNNGDFLLLFSYNSIPSFGNYNKSKIYKMDKLGNMIDSVELEAPNGFKAIIVRYFIKYPEADSSYLVYAELQNATNNYGKSIVFKIDGHLNIYWSKVFGQENAQNFLSQYCIGKNNHIVFTGFDFVTEDALLIEIDSAANEIYTKRSKGADVLSTIYYEPNKNYYKVYNTSAQMIYTYDANTFERMDTTLYLLIPSNTTSISPQGVKTVISQEGDTTYLFPGYMYISDTVPPYHNEWDMGFMRINDKTEVLDYHHYGKRDTTDYYSNFNFDYIDTNKIFLASTSNVLVTPSYPPDMEPRRHWLDVANIKIDGTVNWQYYYKGDVCYYLDKTLATKDGGALLLATRHDWNEPGPLQKDVLIIKIDSLGHYTPNGISKYEEPQQILVYPNPAKDYININTGLYDKLILQIYNTQGQRVCEQKLTQGLSQINISNYMSGLYLYQVTDDKGKVIGKGKWVKAGK